MGFRTPITHHGDYDYYPLAPGGEPLAIDEADELEPLSVSRQVVSGPLAGTQPRGLFRSGTGRIWLHQPIPGTPPDFSTEPPRRISADDVAFRTTI
jgi:hypothetical protein